jgi:alanine dehydrogenase
MNDGDGYRNPSEVSFDALQEALQRNGYLQNPINRNPILLIDTDREIGKETGTIETRVGITPSQAERLMAMFGESNLALTVFVVKGAGEMAGFSDADYQKAGCRLIAQASLASLPERPDVVHALKEPAPHEGVIPGPFMRIGALHLTEHSLGHRSGIGALLKARNFSCMLDGSATGYCSYLMSRGYRTPIVASMSVFAGKIAAQKILENQAALASPKELKIIIIGGGVAGAAAAENLHGKCAELKILEVDDQRIEALKSRLAPVFSSSSTRLSVRKNLEANVREALAGASGLILAQRRGVEPAAHVLSLPQLEALSPGALIVDIAIDQGGSIENPDIEVTDSLAEAIRKNSLAIKQRDKVYFAESNMPRAFPSEASTAHGLAILPYLAGLLALCAIHGGAENAMGALFGRPAKPFAHVDELPVAYRDDYFQMIIQDLRNGIELAHRDGELEICNPDIAKDEALVTLLRKAWAGE